MICIINERNTRVVKTIVDNLCKEDIFLACEYSRLYSFLVGNDVPSGESDERWLFLQARYNQNKSVL